MMVRHDEKTSAGRAKMSGSDTGDRLAEVDKVLGCLVTCTWSSTFLYCQSLDVSLFLYVACMKCKKVSK